VSGTIDAYPRRRIARLVEDVGVRRARMGGVPLAALGLLGGVYFAVGGMLYTLILSDPSAAGAALRVAAGLGLAAGLALAVISGAEVFTANILVVMAWAEGLVAGWEVRRFWLIVFLANLAGAVAAAWAVRESGVFAAGDAGSAVAAAEARIGGAFWPAFMRGLIGGVLVCLAVWICFASHTLTDRILAVLLPGTALGAVGFEHASAMMYLVPAGMLHGAEAIDVRDLTAALLPVAIGNAAGGGVLVAAVYTAVYLRGSDGPGA
jgi:formate/nitrite transporter FocA (FNT family)